MDVWKKYEGEKVFIILRNGRKYSGTVVAVEKNHPIVWITIKDKFEKRVTFTVEEIEMIQEERK